MTTGTDLRDRWNSKEATTYHEAGHALVSHLNHWRVKRVCIVDSQHGRGFCEYYDPCPPAEADPLTPTLATLLAGLVAQAYFVTGNFINPLNLADRVPTLWEEDDLKDAWAHALKHRGNAAGAQSYLDSLYLVTLKIFKAPEHWAAVDSLARRLVAIGSLDGDEVEGIIWKAMLDNIQ